MLWLLFTNSNIIKMKKLGMAGYFCGMESKEAFEVLRKFKGNRNNVVFFVVKTYVGKKLFAFSKNDYNSFKNEVKSESNLLSLIKEMCKTYLLTGVNVVLSENLDAEEELKFLALENNNNNSTFSLGIKQDGSYIIIANNWFELI
jgi:hypothetical protein